MQQVSSRVIERTMEWHAAVQHDFTEVLIQGCEFGQYPYRSFAAPHPAVSVPDKAAVPCSPRIQICSKCWAADISGRCFLQIKLP